MRMAYRKRLRVRSGREFQYVRLDVEVAVISRLTSSGHAFPVSDCRRPARHDVADTD